MNAEPSKLDGSWRSQGPDCPWRIPAKTWTAQWVKDDGGYFRPAAQCSPCDGPINDPDNLNHKQGHDFERFDDALR
jgi:hypothetical protein